MSDFYKALAKECEKLMPKLEFTAEHINYGLQQDRRVHIRIYTKGKYPTGYVGLIDIENGIASFHTAILSKGDLSIKPIKVDMADPSFTPENIVMYYLFFILSKEKMFRQASYRNVKTGEEATATSILDIFKEEK